VLYTRNVFSFYFLFDSVRLLTTKTPAGSFFGSYLVRSKIEKKGGNFQLLLLPLSHSLDAASHLVSLVCVRVPSHGPAFDCCGTSATTREEELWLQGGEGKEGGDGAQQRRRGETEREKKVVRTATRQRTTRPASMGSASKNFRRVRALNVFFYAIILTGQNTTLIAVHLF
jgi:hypothetical protein